MGTDIFPSLVSLQFTSFITVFAFLKFLLLETSPVQSLSAPSYFQQSLVSAEHTIKLVKATQFANSISIVVLLYLDNQTVLKIHYQDIFELSMD